MEKGKDESDYIIPDVYPIQFRLNGQSHSIGIYKDMTVNELNKILKNEFNISKEYDIYGINCNYNVDTIIPLSNVCRLPKFYSQQTNDKYTTNGWELKLNSKYYHQKNLSENKMYNNSIQIFIYFMIGIILFYGIIIPYNLLSFETYSNWINFIHLNIITPYLSDLYFGGNTESEICAEISGQTPSFWDKNVTECRQAINKKITSFVLMVESLLLLIIFIQIAGNFIIIGKVLLKRIFQILIFMTIFAVIYKIS